MRAYRPRRDADAEFWSAIAAKFSQSGEATEKLLRNLGT